MKKSRMPLQSLRPMAPQRTFPPQRDYTSVSVKDLLEAREAYHVYLSTLGNVVATGIGRYLIHEEDWYANHAPDWPRPKGVKHITAAKTLNNTVICPWSWPAVLVFVRSWEEYQNQTLGSQVVPRTLYLPDGRAVPTCVIVTPPDESLPPPPPGPSQNSDMIGGGYACLRPHQGSQSTGTIACLVRRGGSYYALTNRHVAGGDGEVVSAYIRGQYQPFGTTSSVAVDRLAMPDAFAGWPGDHTYLTLDAGLVRIDNIEDWTSQAFGIGEIGDVFDATPQSVTLDLIGLPVRAFGGASGVAEGEIRALFFRFESVGGYDLATDVFVAPRRPGGMPARPLTNPGDSGTLWFYDPPVTPPSPSSPASGQFAPPEEGLRARRLRPIAMQWGGQRILAANGGSSAYALGSFLSTICRELKVEVIRNWSTGHDEYWGKIGHFAIGWKACDMVSGKLGQLMKRNQPRIGFGDSTLRKGSAFRMGRGAFVPLSDVPDYAWIKSRPNEPVQHFADVDIRDIHGGPTLLQQCVSDPKNVSAKVWKDYFDGFAQAGVGPEEGCLPFRVWQIWEAMVGYLKKQPKPDLLRFVAAGGVLAHYIGDASQPMHCSYLHHGVPPMTTHQGRKYPVPRDSAAFKAFKKTREAKVHGIYEETMLEIDPATALVEVTTAMKKGIGLGKGTRSGHQAAVATVQLMFNAQKRLTPKQIIEADDPSLSPKARAAALWANKHVRKATIQSLADSVKLLANLWQSAWTQGGGSSIPATQLKVFTETELENVYRHDRTFVPSLSLKAMARGNTFAP